MWPKVCPKSAVVYITQMLIILGVVIASIVNLSITNDNKEMWISLLCSTIGYILPSPKLRKSSHSEDVEVSIEGEEE